MKQCTTHLLESTSPGDSKDIKVFESLHPLFPHCQYTTEVVFESAKALRVTFDRRCETSLGCVLSFWADEGKTRLIRQMQGPGHDSPRASGQTRGPSVAPSSCARTGSG